MIATLDTDSPIQEDHQSTGSIMTDIGSSGHRRQVSVGLGILTDPETLKSRHGYDNKGNQSPDSKTAQFFNANDLPTPRPPPSLRQSPVTLSADPLVQPSSFAGRLRSLVSAGRNTAVAPAPIPNYLHAKNKPRRASEPDFADPLVIKQPNRLYSDDDDNDDILCLPSPSPAPSSNATSGSYYVFPRGLRVACPSTPLTSIPVISISPSFSPNKTNRVPTLIEEPMLGDVDEDEEAAAQVVRQIKRRSVSPLRYTDEDLTNKMVDKYHIRSLLGVGAFSRVYLADNIEDSQQYAIKAINKDRMFTNARVRSSIEREVGVLKVIDHPNIVRLEATMETEHILCIVLEYIEGGELFDLVQKLHQDNQGRPLDEELVKRIFLQLVGVVRWLHDHNIVHRDLKLENVLIRYDDDDKDHKNPILKVTDFGLARVVDPLGPQLQTRCGSEEYAAPEIVQSLGYDGRLTDTWALGVILYGLLVGYLPFRYQPSRGEKVSQLFYRIVKAQVKWPAEWANDASLGVSLEAREVVEKILVRKPEGRILLKDIESLPWFAGIEPL